MKEKQKAWSVNELSKETGMDRRTIEKRILDGKFEKPYGDDVLKMLRVEKVQTKKRGDGYQRKMDAEAAIKERENRIAQNLEDETYMETSTVKQIFATLCEALEQIPSKLRSELGLTHPQKARAQQLLDEARANAAAKILKTEYES